jgi:class 3 adenylate cyclase/tetratricopeptide (TPR) repeat protein
MSCASCGRPIAIEARFCSHCGAPQAATSEERRIVTVLFADIVGFTSLAEGMDPEDVKHLVDRAFERLARDIRAFGGAVDKVLGDGIIALFGAPIAHEDDAERAVRAALRMQETIGALSDAGPRIRMRIGVNTGEVLVGTTTAGGDYTAMGDVMNSAQRLQELASPGETLVGSATRHATSDAIAYRALGLLPARGRERPLEAWAALEAVRPPGLHRQRGPSFVGRRHEMAMLEAQARLAVEGSRAQLAIIAGEAGMGKTRLASEAASTLSVTFGALVIEGRCLPYGEANVWWPVADLIRQLFDIPPDGAIGAAETILRQGLAKRLPELDGPELDRMMTALLHALGYDTPLRGGDRNRNRSEVKLAFTTLLETELAKRPVLMVLSDMHWAAAAVWELVDHLLTELVRAQLMVMATARWSGDDDPLPRGRYGLSLLQLGPLDDGAAAVLLGQLGLEIDPQVAKELVERSAGNPLFLEELASLVAKRGLASKSELHIDPDELPVTLRGIIAARLDELEPGERSLLEDASVLGRTGPVDGLMTLAKVTGGSDDWRTDLARLADKELLQLDGNRYRFRSDLVRDVVYGRLTKTTRAQQHFGIAQYLEQSQGPSVRNSVAVAIAEHYRAAAQLSAEVARVPGIDRAEVVNRALYWLDQAGERALFAGEPRQAARWYDSGVALAQDDHSLARFVYGRAKARTEIHDIPGARADLDRLESLSGLDQVLVAKALLVRGDVDRKAGDLDLAAARLREAADRLSALHVTDQQALALRLLGLTEMVRSQDGLARQALEGSRAVALAAGDRRAEAWALQTLAWHAFRLGRVEEARTLVDQAIGIFTELDDQGGIAWSRGVLAWVAFHTGQWQEAQKLVDAVLPETRRRGDPRTEGIMLNLDASLHLWSGRAQGAFELAREAHEVAERLDDATLGVQARALQGRALVALGRVEEGAALLAEAFSMADVADDSESRRIAIIANCASAARLGEPERAIRWAARFDTLHEDPSVVGEIDLIVSLALAMLQRGAVGEAASQLQWVADASSTGAGHFADAVGAMVASAQGRTREAEQLIERTLAGSSTYLDRIFALLARASLCTRAGDLTGRAEALAKAREAVEGTDDQPTRLLIELAAAICGAGSILEAEDRMRAGGLDPIGWSRAWTEVSRPTVIQSVE